MSNPDDCIGYVNICGHIWGIADQNKTTNAIYTMEEIIKNNGHKPAYISFSSSNNKEKTDD